MSGDIALSNARNEVLRKVGRNVVNFARMEAMLKLLNAQQYISGAVRDLPEIVAAAKKAASKRPMGRLADEFVRFVYSESELKVEQPSDEASVTFSFRIEADKPFSVERKRALRAVVVERNRLIHQWLPSFDGNSVENCEAFGATLDEQNAKLLPEFEALRAIVTNLRECQRELARYLESDAVRAQLEKGITSA
jgi:hypothetical protein